MKKFVVSFISVLLLTLSFISVLPVSADDSDSVFTDHIFSNLEDSYPHSSYSYMVVSYKSNSFSFYQCFVVSRSLKFFYNSSDRTVSTDGTFIDSFVHRFKEYSCNREVRYGNIVYADIKDFNIIYSDLPVYEGDVPIYTDTNAPFKSPVNAQFDFKSDIEFFCCLNDNATSLPVDNRVWIEVYDTLVAVETLVYKPYKYVYTKTITSSSPDVPNKHEQVIGDYLLANSVGPHYSISVDTLLHAGCKTDYYYTARAFVYNGSKPFEIANLTFKISSEGISTVDPTLKDPDNPDDPIMKTWNNDNRTYNYYNVNTGAEVDKDKLVYKFDSSVDPSVNGSGQDISDFDFNSDFSTDLTQGAGLVRTLFDKIIQSAGLSGFMITVLSVAVVGWFIFGSRR
nr:MAG TPA: hypothetical protein [Inoviridae sp.]